MLEDEMKRGRFANPERFGDEVIRTPVPAASNIHKLFDHFWSQGVSLTPRFLGWTEEGKERLSFIPGNTGYPPISGEIRSDEALINVARAIRTAHDASVSFMIEDALPWNSLEVCKPVVEECIGHGDLAPWNFVFEGTQVVGIIDWDTAGPSDRLWDLAYAAYQFVPFHSPETMAAFGWSKEPERARRLALFLDAYGMPGREREIVDLAVIRLLAMAENIEREIAKNNPKFETHRLENHAHGYRTAALSLANRRGLYVN